ncbi:MAG: hypothetical protein KJ571_18885 [Bacteroidetes bacterium]|nr:hypothetical protein [Bacteroidota bacterium]
MENLFEIIILIVFVLSGLNALFGKKKKGRVESENTGNADSPAPARKRVPENEIDLLQEIFGLKKDNSKSPDPFDEPSAQNTGYGYQDSSWNPEDDFSDKENLKISEMKARQKRFDELSKIDYDKSVVSKERYDFLILNNNSSGTIVNKRALALKRILKNKKSVKDSIIIADILNKPKAYRRRGNDLLR